MTRNPTTDLLCHRVCIAQIMLVLIDPRTRSNQMLKKIVLTTKWSVIATVTHHANGIRLVTIQEILMVGAQQTVLQLFPAEVADGADGADGAD